MKKIKKIKKKAVNDKKIKQVTKDMTFHEVLEKFPETNTVFMKYQMFCALGCPAAQQETIEEGAQVHGIDIKKLILELNEAIKK